MIRRADEYFKTSSQTLHEVLKDSMYLIPEYQRAFSWSKEGGEFEVLWSDIVKAESANFSNFKPVPEAGQVPHFIGAVVTEIPADLLQQQESVIDGQQRLTTCTVLLAVLCDFVQKINDEKLRIPLLTQLQISVRAYGPNLFQPRITLNQEQDFFLDIVVHPTSREDRERKLSSYDRNKLNTVKRRIFDCAVFFMGKLNDHLGDPGLPDFDQKVQQFSLTILYLVTVLKVVVAKSGLAYTIFETLNTRGLELTQADLIKNEILKRSSPDPMSGGSVRDRALNSWVKMLERLPDEDSEPTDYIRHYYVSRHDYVKKSALFDTIVRSLDTPPPTASEFVSDLEREADAYQKICGISTTGKPTTDEYITEINSILKVTASYPILIAGAAVFNIADPDFQSLTKVVRDFCFRFFTVGSGSPERMEQIAGQAARELRQNKKLAAVYTMLQSYSPDAVFEEDFSNFRTKTSALGFYIIRQIEIHLSRGSGVVPFKQSPYQHLEHIMPQRPSGSDPSQWAHVRNDTRYSEYVHRVGNFLVLESDINQRVKNKTFADKKTDYSRSRLLLPHNVAGGAYLTSGDWDFDSIVSRQKDLATTALKVWSLK